MKNRIAVLISVVLLIGGSIFVAAQDKSGMHQHPPMQQDGRPQPPPPPMGEFSPRMMEHLSRELNLTDAQQAEMKSTLDAARPTLEPLMQRMDELHKQLDAATANGHFDEAQVRAIATQQAQVMVELTVEHERMKAKLYNMLTPEQRAKADQMHGGGHPHPGGPEGHERPPSQDN